MSIELKQPKHVRKNSILLYGDYAELLSHLPMEERGKLFTGLLEYARDGSLCEPRFDNQMTALVYTVIMSQLRRDRERYLDVCQKNSLKAKARWNKDDVSP